FSRKPENASVGRMPTMAIANRRMRKENAEDFDNRHRNCWVVRLPSRGRTLAIGSAFAIQSWGPAVRPCGAVQRWRGGAEMTAWVHGGTRQNTRVKATDWQAQAGS